MQEEILSVLNTPVNRQWKLSCKKTTKLVFFHYWIFVIGLKKPANIFELINFFFSPPRWKINYQLFSSELIYVAQFLCFKRKIENVTLWFVFFGEISRNSQHSPSLMKMIFQTHIVPVHHTRCAFTVFCAMLQYLDIMGGKSEKWFANLLSAMFNV